MSRAVRLRRPRQARGFTLIEVLLATMLLATGLALAFATLRAATATAQRGEAIAERSEATCQPVNCVALIAAPPVEKRMAAPRIASRARSGWPSSLTSCALTRAF